MDSPLPSSKAPPSIWADAAATPKTKWDGKGLEYVNIGRTRVGVAEGSGGLGGQPSGVGKQFQQGGLHAGGPDVVALFAGVQQVGHDVARQRAVDVGEVAV